MSAPEPTEGERSLLPAVIFTYRRAFVIAVHLALWSLCFVGAFMLRFDSQVPSGYWPYIAIWLPVLLGIRTVLFFYFGMFHGLWRYTGARDLVSLGKAATASTALFVLYIHFLGPRGVPRSVFVIDWLASVMAVGGLRFGIRTLRELASQAAASSDHARRKILIVGAGDAGEMLVREIRKTQGARYDITGFVDDNPHKIREQIHGVPVLGPLAAVPDLVRRYGVDEVIVAIPSARGNEMRRIVELCKASGAQIRTIPGVDSLIDGRVTVNQIRPVAIEDLLGREPVQLDSGAISGFVRDNLVLVTGAGGSIGAELCRQVCRFGPAKVVLIEQAENNLFHIHRELRESFPSIAIVPRIADICDSRRMEHIFSRHKPQVVFHAAAHKHVPMMEWNPGEAIKNNLFGSKKLADLADGHGVQAFVMISTDKAVNPTSIMGVSKRAAEIYIQALSQRSKTRFITVRFGNVLGSAGSVIPIFQEQIARGGPLTVTHPEMKRYFMTIPEACQLVMQAATMGRGGEIFVLDMGEPVKIVDLARDLITLSGFTPGEDIEIRFTGIRPGEKLFEELSCDGEAAEKTLHPKIAIGRFKPHRWEDIQAGLAELHGLTDGADDAMIRATFGRLVPEYQPMVLTSSGTSGAFSAPPPPRPSILAPVASVTIASPSSNVIPLKR